MLILRVAATIFTVVSVSSAKNPSFYKYRLQEVIIDFFSKMGNLGFNKDATTAIVFTVNILFDITAFILIVISLFMMAKANKKKIKYEWKQ